MDIIYLSGLKVDAVIGAWEWERRIRHELILDIEIGGDLSRASTSDELHHTIDYKAVSDHVTEFTKGSRFKLLEALAEAIAQEIMRDFPAKWIRIKATKQGVVPGVRSVGIVIERSVE